MAKYRIFFLALQANLFCPTSFKSLQNFHFSQHVCDFSGDTVYCKQVGIAISSKCSFLFSRNTHQIKIKFTSTDIMAAWPLCTLLQQMGNAHIRKQPDSLPHQSIPCLLISFTLRHFVIKQSLSSSKDTRFPLSLVLLQNGTACMTNFHFPGKHQGQYGLILISITSFAMLCKYFYYLIFVCIS